MYLYVITQSPVALPAARRAISCCAIQIALHDFSTAAFNSNYPVVDCACPLPPLPLFPLPLSSLLSLCLTLLSMLCCSFVYCSLTNGALSVCCPVSCVLYPLSAVFPSLTTPAHPAHPAPPSPITCCQFVCTFELHSYNKFGQQLSHASAAPQHLLRRSRRSFGVVMAEGRGAGQGRDGGYAYNLNKSQLAALSSESSDNVQIESIVRPETTVRLVQIFY